VTVLVGSGAGGVGDGGAARMALLNQPKSVVADPAGNVFVTDSRNKRIRRIDAASGTIVTVAGNGTLGFSGDGGPGTAAALNGPRDVELGPDGHLYIADTDNHRIRVLDRRTGIITTVAGQGPPGFAGDRGPARSARFFRPWGIAHGPDGALYVADTRNNRIRRIAP
jgi:DNA-binding beta-propeller fold protein YncE